MSKSICVITNPKSGTNSNDANAIDRVMAILGDQAQLIETDPESGFEGAVEKALEQGCATIVAAGGDGTIVGISSLLLDKDVTMGVLPLGTFNFFSRGLGIPEDPEEAAKALLHGEPKKISVGSVNGQIFLNNASLGVYPVILKNREATYKHWGRSRIVAHISMLKTFLQFDRVLKIRIMSEGVQKTIETPLVFVARSSYQLDMFNLEGEDAIKDDNFAVFTAVSQGRFTMLKNVWRLVRRTMKQGRDFDLYKVQELDIDTGRKEELVAFDGEKAKMKTPLEFRMHTDALRILVPKEGA